MTPLTIVLSLVSGGVVGFVLGLIGGGGSILAVPLLVYVVGYHGDPHVAIGTTALAVAASALASLARHHGAGHVRLRAGLWFALPGAAGALLGARLGLLTRGDRLLFLFALVMLAVAWRLGTQRDAGEDARRRERGEHAFRAPLVAGAGFVVGATSGFFGIGGGFLAVPALLWAADLDMREAIGTSLLAVATFGLTTAARYGLEGKIDWLTAALFIAGGITLGVAGARVGAKLPKRALRAGFALVLVLVAAYMLERNWAAFTS